MTPEQALFAIIARLDGELEHPTLRAFGVSDDPLTDVDDPLTDVYALARAALYPPEHPFHHGDTRHVYTLALGEQLKLLPDVGIVIAHPDRPPRIVERGGTARVLSME
jgi:hypothetical protein